MEQLTVTLLVRIAVAASLASIMVRFQAFRNMLMREERTLNQRMKLALGVSAAFAAGVGIRVLTKSYRAWIWVWKVRSWPAWWAVTSRDWSLAFSSHCQPCSTASISR